MNASATGRALSGVVPIAPTPFDDHDEVDDAGQKRVVDFLIDADADAICILANYSEQFLLTDAERDTLVELCLSHVDGRVPVIVTCSHFSSRTPHHPDPGPCRWSGAGDRHHQPLQPQGGRRA